MVILFFGFKVMIMVNFFLRLINWTGLRWLMLIILFFIERVFKTINYVLKEGDIKLIVDEELNKSDKKGQRDVNEPNSLKCS